MLERDQALAVRERAEWEARTAAARAHFEQQRACEAAEREARERPQREREAEERAAFQARQAEQIARYQREQEAKEAAERARVQALIDQARQKAKESGPDLLAGIRARFGTTHETTSEKTAPTKGEPGATQSTPVPNLAARPHEKPQEPKRPPEREQTRDPGRNRDRDDHER